MYYRIPVRRLGNLTDDLLANVDQTQIVAINPTLLYMGLGFGLLALILWGGKRGVSGVQRRYSRYKRRYSRYKRRRRQRSARIIEARRLLQEARAS
jgi:hypothetical protein